MTRLAVSISAKDQDGFLRRLKCAQLQGAEAVELRVDALDQPDAETVTGLIHAVKKARLPVIVTCRDVSEGGVKPIDFSHKLGLYKKAIELGADYIDIEFSTFKHPDVHSVIKAALEDSATKLILSAHNFDGPFEDVFVLHESILNLFPQAIPKIVCQARHITDCFAIFELLQDADNPLIAFCMGEAGKISRVLAKKLGAEFSYAAIDSESATAPGQLTVEQMKTLYRWDKIDSETEIFGLIGNPVGHSLSPLLFNACFDQDDVNAVYLPFLVEGEQLEFSLLMDLLRKNSKLNFGGFSVTIPHKTNALIYAKRQGEYIEPLAVAIGSVNTLKIGFNGLISAYNTDYAGAIDALTHVIGEDRHRLHKTSIAVVGAGGVARAVVAGLMDAGARVTIYNRTLHRAQALAREFKCKAAELDQIAQSDAEILINCTSIGMYPQTQACPVAEGVIRPEMTVFDTVYNPLETVLLQRARTAGARTVSGAEMFVRQAMAQYKIFIGPQPDEELMRRVVLEKLSPTE
jgi:3-dehydroquinate dehydratase / shikimate dehydrogenase